MNPKQCGNPLDFFRGFSTTWIAMEVGTSTGQEGKRSQQIGTSSSWSQASPFWVMAHLNTFGLANMHKTCCLRCSVLVTVAAHMTTDTCLLSFGTALFCDWCSPRVRPEKSHTVKSKLLQMEKSFSGLTRNISVFHLAGHKYFRLWWNSSKWCSHQYLLIFSAH